MNYTDDALYPENMKPLIITAAPYGPSWLPGDLLTSPSLGMSRSRRRWIATTPAPPSCTSTCEDPATGKLTAKIEHFNYIMERIKKAVPKLRAIQVGGSIAFDHPKDDGQVNWLSYDTRSTCSRK